MTVTKSADPEPRRFPTSREINLAIDTLRRAGLDAQAMRLLTMWNASRLVEAAQRVGTHEELGNLFVGLSPCVERDGSDVSFSE